MLDLLYLCLAPSPAKTAVTQTIIITTMTTTTTRELNLVIKFKRNKEIADGTAFMYSLLLFRTVASIKETEACTCVSSFFRCGFVAEGMKSNTTKYL